MKQNIFDLETQYQLYLERVGLSEDKMNPIQKVETKRAFYGACGQMLILLRDDIADVAEESEDKAIEILEGLTNQVSEFWNKQI